LKHYLRKTNLTILTDECSTQIKTMLTNTLFNQTNELSNSTPCITLLLESIKNELETTQITQSCQNSLNFYFKSLFQERAMWSIKVIDSIGQRSSGLFTGTLNLNLWLGEYDECIDIDDESDWQSKMCYFVTFDKFLMPPIVQQFGSTFFSRGFCSSTQCSKQDLAILFQDYLLNQKITKNETIKINETNFNCVGEEYSLELDTKAIVAICVLFIIIAFVTFATCFQLYLNAKDYIAKNRNDIYSNSFLLAYLIKKPRQLEAEIVNIEKSKLIQLLINCSVYTNLMKIFNLKKIDGQLDCLNGIRFLSMAWVVLGHMCLDFVYPNSLANDAMILSRWNKTKWSGILSKGTFAVDTFLLLRFVYIIYFRF